jgi:hypothetical protein
MPMAAGDVGNQLNDIKRTVFLTAHRDEEAEFPPLSSTISRGSPVFSGNRVVSMTAVSRFIVRFPGRSSRRNSVTPDEFDCLVGRHSSAVEVALRIDRGHTGEEKRPLRVSLNRFRDHVGHPNAGCYSYLVAGNHAGRGKCVGHLVRDTRDFRYSGYTRQERSEFVASKSGHYVCGTDTSAQAICDQMQKFIANGVPQAVVDRFESVRLLGHLGSTHAHCLRTTAVASVPMLKTVERSVALLRWPARGWSMTRLAALPPPPACTGRSSCVPP